MENSKEIKEVVKKKYSEIAVNPKQDKDLCCTETTCCANVEFKAFEGEYKTLEGYNKDADLKLGCGMPTEFARIKKGDTVVDLGSGAGNDCFVARSQTGESGMVIGLDFTEEMLKRANENLAKTGYKNIKFVYGDIEKMPIEDAVVDVVVSNCVLNLCPDKEKAFSEIFRILKPGGHFSVSDIVLTGDLPDSLRKVAELYAGCISGALKKEEYLGIIEKTGFKNIKVDKEYQITLPEETLQKFLTKEQLQKYRESGTGAYSINVYAEK
jgi:ubiquinone/menaquinone biosynthesis C-methylase UbiE